MTRSRWMARASSFTARVTLRKAASARHLRVALLLASLAMLHALVYAMTVPLWQMPDEPTQFEYAALTSRLGRVPRFEDRDLALERAIADSLVRHAFFEFLIGRRPQPLPTNLEDVRATFFMPRQVGIDPPLYFTLAALPLRMLSAHTIERQALALRLLGVLLVGGTVLCAYCAAREVAAGDASIAPAATLLLALHPMFIFVSVGVGDDGLANLLGAAICWSVLRCVRGGATRQRTAVLVVLTLLGLLSKRTLVPLVLVITGIALIMIGRRCIWGPSTWAARLDTLGIVLSVSSVVAGGRDTTSAADWVGTTASSSVARVLAAPLTGRPALLLPPDQVATQAMTDVAAEWTQNQLLQVRARVWTSSARAHGHLRIDVGWTTITHTFEASDQPRVVRVQAVVPLYCPYVHVTLQAQDGPLYVDQVRAESARRPGLNLLTNGEATSPALQADSVPGRLTRYLHLRELAWVWRSGRLWEPPPLGWALGRIFFVSFWGQFGWMSLPMVGGTYWELALAIVCGGGVCPVWLGLLRL